VLALVRVIGIPWQRRGAPAYAAVRWEVRRLDGVATLTGALSGVKFCAYAASVVAIGVLAAAKVSAGSPAPARLR
jgi:hypothetical protein